VACRKDNVTADAAESEYFGQEAVRFYTRYKSVMQRWPDSIA
jgi:hypothetical protein